MQPVTILTAGRISHSRIPTMVFGVAGSQAAAACSSVPPMSPLATARICCSWSPQLRPVIFRSCAILGRTRLRRLRQCGPKVSVRSRVPPPQVTSARPHSGRAGRHQDVATESVAVVLGNDQKLSFITGHLYLVAERQADQHVHFDSYTSTIVLLAPKCVKAWHINLRRTS